MGKLVTCSSTNQQVKSNTQFPFCSIFVLYCIGHLCAAVIIMCAALIQFSEPIGQLRYHSPHIHHTHRVCCIFSDFHNVKQQISRCINLYAIKAHTVCFLASFACTKMVEALVVSVCVCMHACMRTHLCLLIFRLAATNVL